MTVFGFLGVLALMLASGVVGYDMAYVALSPRVARMEAKLEDVHRMERARFDALQQQRNADLAEYIQAHDNYVFGERP